MYVAIDVETTGLNPERHQVLQIGAVALTHTDINQCETFETKVDPRKGALYGAYGDDIVGEPYALALNVELLKVIDLGHCDSAAQAASRFDQWLSKFDLEKTGRCFINAVGVNFGGFDWQFLKKLPGFRTEPFNYRHTEVGSRFATPFGPVSMTKRFAEIAERHRIEGNAHEAVFDAKCTLAALTDSFVEERIVG